VSHFVVYALVPEGTPPDAVEQKLNELLAPYNEGTAVEEYDRPCYCVGRAAQRAAREAASAVESVDAIRERFAAVYATQITRKDALELVRSPTPEEKAAHRALDAETEAAWRSADYIGGFEARSAEALATHPLRESADPECDECAGKGTSRSTYNPKSKWDWWRVGGRWDGLLVGEVRRSDNGFNFGEEHTQLRHNSRVVASLPTPLPEDLVPFAIVTPDGAWHDRGRMGWWGMVSDATDRDQWGAQVREQLAAHPTALAVVLDCHI